MGVDARDTDIGWIWAERRTGLGRSGKRRATRIDRRKERDEVVEDERGGEGGETGAGGGEGEREKEEKRRGRPRGQAPDGDGVTRPRAPPRAHRHCCTPLARPPPDALSFALFDPSAAVVANICALLPVFSDISAPSTRLQQ